MASLLTTVVLLSVLFSGLTYAEEESQFDYFTLALQWPSTACEINSKSCCPYNGCCPGGDPPVGFTIEGLWPDYNDGTYPTCCPGPAYNANEISSVSSAMAKYWMVLNCKMRSSCYKKRPIWAHQWEKHGTCATSVTGSQQEYFLTAIQLYLKYNVTDVLVKAGYKPSTKTKTYPLTGIVSAIEEAFDTTPQVTCNGNAIKGVRLCFTKDFKVRECVGGSSCPEYVTLPKFEFRNVTKTADWLSAIESVV